MVVGEHFLMTDEEVERAKMEAVYAHEKAKDERARLIHEAKAVAARHRKIAALWEAIEAEPEYPLQSEAPLLMLSQRDYERLGLDSERALANAIAASRKKVREAAAVRGAYSS